jgi:transcriptional regulator with XRE-family HTH domain
MAACNFHQNVRQLRTDYGMSVASAADIANVSAPTWYKYEQGTQFPGPNTIDAIASALRVHPQALFRDLIIEQKGES